MRGARLPCSYGAVKTVAVRLLTSLLAAVTLVAAPLAGAGAGAQANDAVQVSPANDVRVTDLGRFSVDLAWEAPVVTGGTVTDVLYEYDLVEVATGQPPYPNAGASTTVTNAFFPVLEEGTTYRFALTSRVSIEGVAEPLVVESEPLEFTTLSTREVQPVQNIAVEATAVSATVTWEPGAVTGGLVNDPVVEYFVELYDGQDLFLDEAYPSEPTVTFTGLEPGADFRVDISMWVGTGPDFADSPVVSQTFSTPEIGIGALSDVQLVTDDTTLRGTWPAVTTTAPMEGLQYTIEVFDAVGDPLPEEPITSRDFTTAPTDLLIVDGLDPATTYTVRIRTQGTFEDILYMGPEFVTTVTTQTPAPIPGTPVNVTISPATPTSATVSWSPGTPDTATSYTVTRRSGLGLAIETFVVTSGTSITLNLDTDAALFVTVSATNETGTSADSERVGPYFSVPSTVVTVPTPDQLDGLSGDLPVTFDPEAETLSADVSSATLLPTMWTYGIVFSEPQPLGWSQSLDGETVTFSLATVTLPPGEHRLVLADMAGTLIGSGTFVVPANEEENPNNGGPEVPVTPEPPAPPTTPGTPGFPTPPNTPGGTLPDSSGETSPVSAGTGAGVDRPAAAAEANASGTRTLPTTGSADVTAWAAVAALLAALGLGAISASRQPQMVRRSLDRG